MIDDTNRKSFRSSLGEYYQVEGRHDLPWRQPNAHGTFDPYHILVSEMMLQQTQVGRVIPKYQEFVERFPDIESLAAAPQSEVMKTWSGLGYNRRAKFLHQSAILIVRQHDGQMPQDLPVLIKLPGVGSNTAGAILAYAFNQPTVFVETNIRTVFIHHFFKDTDGKISEQAIITLVADTLDHEQPREWYWALMDYGTYLKQSVGNLNVQSSSYTRQSRFVGSRRQLRGHVLRLLGERSHNLAELQKSIDDERLEAVLSELLNEELIGLQQDQYQL